MPILKKSADIADADIDIGTSLNHIQISFMCCRTRKIRTKKHRVFEQRWIVFKTKLHGLVMLSHLCYFLARVTLWPNSYLVGFLHEGWAYTGTGIVNIGIDSFENGAQNLIFPKLAYWQWSKSAKT